MVHFNLLQTLSQMRPCFIIDGALATELEARGADLSDSLWSARILIENPQLIRQVHYDYFAAGADIAITASYQATYPGYARYGIDTATTSILLARSVELAQQARADYWHVYSQQEGAEKRRPYPLVAASIGPYGAYLADGSEYRGEYGISWEELVEFHRLRLQTLVAAAPDLLACETIPCLVEAEALVELLAILSRTEPSLPPAWMSFACRNDHQLNSGESFAHAVQAIAVSPHVGAIGINCTAPQYITSLLHRARTVTTKPLLVYPNRGEAWDAQARAWVPNPSAPALDAYVPEWLAAGAIGIGGCCRTTPDDIRRLARCIARQSPQ